MIIIIMAQHLQHQSACKWILSPTGFDQIGSSPKLLGTLVEARLLLPERLVKCPPELGVLMDPRTETRNLLWQEPHVRRQLQR